MDISQTQLMVPKESIFLKFDKNNSYSKRNSKYSQVIMIPLEQRTFRDTVPTFGNPVQRSITIHCESQSGHSTNPLGIPVVIRLSVTYRVSHMMFYVR